MDDKTLMQMAQDARKNSYSPYSHFRVGAALLTKGGKVYTGCNVENASFSATNCAERTAIFKAVSEGVREFAAIAIVGNDVNTKIGEGDFCPPCGVCRQVMCEFCSADFEIIIAKGYDDFEVHTLGELVPLISKPI